MTRRATSLLGAAGAVFLAAAHAVAAPVEITQSTPDLYTQAFVRQALERYDRDGRDDALAYYNSMASVDGAWYLFIFEADGTLVAHPTIPDLVGQNWHGPLGIDPTGYAFGPVLGTAPAEGKWVHYQFLNPATGEQGAKHSWVVRHDGLIFGSGWYEPDPPKSDPAAFTQAFVEKAIAHYDKAGRAATLAYYNSAASMDGAWYLFMVDPNGIVIATANVPEVLGKSLYGPEGIDPTGHAFGPAIGAAPAEGAWVDYVYRNPATGAAGTKHSWVVRHDGLIFGSGWYEPN